MSRRFVQRLAAPIVILIVATLLTNCSVQFDLGGNGGGDGSNRRPGGSGELGDLKVAAAGSMIGYSRSAYATLEPTNGTPSPGAR